MVFMYTQLEWITERMYDHISIYTGYIQGGLGAINLDFDKA